MKKFLFIVLALLGAWCAPANAQNQPQALVVATCGTPPISYVAGTYGILTMDTTGKLCDSGNGGGGGTQNVNLTQILGAAPSLTNPLWVSPATGATFPVSGTVTANQGTANATPWNDNIIQWASVTLGAATAWGTAPSGNVPGVNANILGPLGQQLAAASVPVVLTAAQITTLTPPTTVAATQSGTWTVQPGNTPNTTPWLMAPAASASGGATPYHVASAASNNSTNVKSTPGTVYDLTLINTTTTLGDFRFYDSASAPTCSSATGVVNNLPVQSNAISPGLHLNYPGGKLFANGISFCYTGAVADNDNTNAATGVQINIDYK